MTQRNLAILLTPPGTAAIAVVRLMGPAMRAFLRQHFVREVVAGRCIHGDISDGGRVIDDAVVVLGSGGTCADLNLHGGPWVVRSVLELAARAGFDVLDTMPDEALPEEAVDGDTSLDREVLSHVPLARTELALRILLAQREAWGALARDVRENPEREARLGAILADQALFWLLHPPRVAIVGAPNVGKSTLANQLFAQERSITADLPGTTRDWVGEIANLDGLAVMLVDTPGLRQTDDPIERLAIERSGEQIRRADLVVLVLDPTQPLKGEQERLIESNRKAICVINKSDRPARWDIAAVMGIHTVATTGQGIDAVRREIRGYFGCEGMEVCRPRWWTQRQKDVLAQAMRDPNKLTLYVESPTRD